MTATLILKLSSFAGSPFARATAGAASSKTAATNATCLAKHVHGEQRDDDASSRAGEQRDQCGREHDADVAIAHPFARSTSRTLNGAWPWGAMSNLSPQWPTITSAG